MGGKDGEKTEGGRFSRDGGARWWFLYHRGPLELWIGYLVLNWAAETAAVSMSFAYQDGSSASWSGTTDLKGNCGRTSVISSSGSSTSFPFPFPPGSVLAVDCRALSASCRCGRWSGACCCLESLRERKPLLSLLDVLRAESLRGCELISPDSGRGPLGADCMRRVRLQGCRMGVMRRGRRLGQSEPRVNVQRQRRRTELAVCDDDDGFVVRVR